MKNLIFLRGFNNYYDRRLKVLTTVAEYLQYNYNLKPAVNFTPGDGVTTSLVSNWGEDWTPDYLVVIDEFDNIVSRWFILKATRTLNGQYRVNLRRDVLADNYNSIIEAPMFVQKANLDSDSPFLFNTEGMEFNQIKVGEELLTDETKTPWIVGYLAKGDDRLTGLISASQETTTKVGLGTLGITLDDINDPTKGGHFYKVEGNISFQFNYNYTDNGTQIIRIKAPVDPYRGNVFQGSYAGTGLLSFKSTTLQSFQANQDSTIKRNYVVRDWSNNLKSHKDPILNSISVFMEGKTTPIQTLAQWQSTVAAKNQLVFSSNTNKYYNFNYAEETSTDVTHEIKTQSFETPMRAIMQNALDELVENANPEWLMSLNVLGIFPIIYYTIKKYRVNLIEEPMVAGQISVNLSANGNKTIDAPYDMIAMPFTEQNMLLANQMILNGGSKVFDFQLLPFCPVREMIDANGINLGLGTAGTNFDYIKEQTNNISYVLWATRTSNAFPIFRSIPTGSSPEEIKVVNETEFIRLSSPNYNGSFDFNVAKNKGVDYFTVAYTYKPFSPFIQVAPNFKGLYGSTYNDGRGLILNGDFSLTMMTDAWTQYELNNKNYESIFNTEVKTMDFAHKQSMISGGIGVGLQATAMGMGAGLMSGNPIVGAMAGVGSAVGGIADLAMVNSVYQSNKQGKLDMFNYQLGNIKALPNTLNKVSAYNIRNKYFPFIEYYSATDAEKTALKNKLKYEGMTVMVIGTMGEYVGARADFNYFKGQLIQVGKVAEDFNTVDAIAVELEKGVYIG